MKTLLTATTLMLALVLGQSVKAESWYASFGHDRHRGWSSWSSRHSSYFGGRAYSSGFHRRASHHYRHRNRRHYNRSHYNRSHYGRFDSGHGYSRHGQRRHGFDGGSLLGGIVLGSILSNSLQHSYHRPRYETVRYRSRPVVRSSPVVYVNSPPVRRPQSSGRRLLRDLQGNCFEISRTASGDELRTRLEPTACEF